MSSTGVPVVPPTVSAPLAQAAAVSVVTTPAPTITWVGSTSGFWDDASNWRDSSGVSRTPTANDDVLVDVAGATPTVTVRSDQTVHSLLSHDGLSLTGGTLTLRSDSEIDGALSVANANLSIGGTLATTGATTWNNVILTGSGKLLNTGTLAFAGSDFTASEIDNSGTLDGTAGTLQLDFFAATTLNNTGLVDMQGDASITSQASGDAFNNSGTFRKSGGNGTSSVTSVFNNNGGTVDAESGTLAIAGGSHTGGVFTAGAGAVLSFSGRTILTGNYSGGGAGQIRFVASNDVFNWWTAGTGGATFNFSSPAVQMTGKFSANGATITNTGYLNLSPASGSATLLGNWSNSGTIAQLGNTALDFAATVDNTATGVWDFQGDSNLFPGGTGTASAAPSFINHGTLRKSAGNGTSLVSGGAFSNAGGTIDVHTGTLSLGSNGSFSTGGTFQVSTGATLDLANSADTSGNVAVSYAGLYAGNGGGKVQLAGNVLAAAGAGVTFNLPAGMFQWTGGGIAAGTAGAHNLGSIDVAGAGTKTLGGTLRNDGTINLKGGNLQLDDLGVGTLDNGGLVDMQGDFGFSHRGADNAGIVNSGTLLKSGGTSDSTGNASFANNGGTVDVRTGTFTVNGGTWSGGKLSASTGATLALVGSHTLSGTLSGAGTGQIQFGSTVTDTLAAIGAGATLDFESTPLQWLNGRLDGGSAGLTNRGTIVRINTGTTTNPGYIFGHVDNAGTIVQSGVNVIEFASGALLTNLAGGLIDLQGDGAMLNVSLGAGTGHALVNHGTIRKSVGTYSNIAIGDFDTAGGTLDVEAGTLAIAGGSNHGGAFQVASGATLDLADSRDTSGNVHVTYSGSFTGSGAGTVLLAGNTVTAGTGGTTFNLPQGMFQWTGGAIDGGAGGFTNAGFISLAGTGSKFVSGLLINNGTMQHQAGNLQLDDTNGAGTLQNNGLYDMLGDVAFVRQFLVPSAIHNAGTMRKSGGSGTAGVGSGLPFDNTGTVEVRSGTFALAAFTALDPTVAQISGTTLTGGHWIVGANATLRLPTIVTNQGDITLDGPGSILAAIAGLNANAGSLTLSGGRSFTTTGSLANTGTLNLGPGSTLNVAGTYTQGSNATLASQLGGSPASGQFGQLVSSGNATLDGTFRATLVNGYGPAQGDTFPVVRFPTHGGAFASVVLPTDGGIQFTPTLSATGYSLQANTTAADLKVGAITLPGGALAPGQSASVDVAVSNVGGSTADGSWTDSVYLSTDGTLDAGDTLLGRVTHTGPVAAGTTYHDSLTAALPPLADGTYKIIVLADSRSQVPDANRANNTGVSAASLVSAVPTLTVGTPAKGSLTDGQDTWYHLLVAPGANLNLLANALGGAGVEVYLKRGALPTRSDFDQTVSSTDASPTLALANAAGGDYYVLLHARPGGTQTYSLAATLAPFAITGFSTTTAATSTEALFRLDVLGSQFTPQTQVTLLAPDGTAYTGIQSTFVDSTHVQVSFDLTNAPKALYTVRATDGTQTATAATTLDATGAVPSINYYASTTILAPAEIRVGASFGVTVKITTLPSGLTILPVINLDTSNVAATPHVEFNDPELPLLVQPGTSLTFGQGFTPTPAADGVVSTAHASLVNMLQTINWDAQKEQTRPKSISAEAWDAVWANLRPRLGNIVGEYYRLLEGDSFAVGSAKIDDLFGFEIMQANDQMQSPVTPSSLDLAFPAPGPALDFGRSFLGDSIAGRYSLGRLGRGWVDNFDFSARSDATTKVITIHEGGMTRYFAPDGQGGFAGLPGDAGTLSLVAGGYQLREKIGNLTAFHADGTLDYLEDSNHNRITAGYSGGQMTSLTHSDGDRMTLVYNAQGRLAQVTDPAGRTATYTYDASGQELLSVTTAAGTTSYTYTSDANGPRAHAITSISSSNGTHVFYDYDSQGRLLTQQLDGGAQRVDYSYGTGSMRATDAQGHGTTVHFDVNGRVARVEGPTGQVALSQFDSNGQLSSIGAVGGGSTNLAYDALGNVKQATDPSGATDTFGYDPAHAGMSQFTDARGNGFSNAFDSNGNPVQTTMADGSASSYAYDANGNLVQSVDRNGQVTRTTRDARGLATLVTLADGSTVAYAYDAHANLVSATDAHGTITLSYDSADRMTRIAYPDGRFISYAYNAGGQRTQMADSTGFTTNYSYDAAGRLVRLTDGTGALITAYVYDATGRLTRKDQGNGNHTDYTYDASGQVTLISNVAADGSVNSSYAYTYDTLGRRTSMTTTEGTTRYGYDADSRLTSATTPDGRIVAYTYDAAGNRVQVDDGGAVTTYTSNSLNEYTDVGGASQTYDAAGNLVTTGGGAASYGYDALGRLVSVNNASGSWSFEYDALGNRVASVHNGQRTEFLVDPTGLGNVVGSFDGSGALSAHYAYGVGLASQVDAGGNAAYYDFDATGSTVGLSGAGGSYLNSYSYTAFGQVRSSTQSVANPFQFGGAMGVQTNGTGLLFMRARSYDSSQGRFTQADPIGVAGGSNLYSYAANNPLSLSDSSGLAPILVPTPDQAARIADVAVKLFNTNVASWEQAAGQALSEEELAVVWEESSSAAGRMVLQDEFALAAGNAEAVGDLPLALADTQEIAVDTIRMAAQPEAVGGVEAGTTIGEAAASGVLYGVLAAEVFTIGWAAYSIYEAESLGHLPPCPSDSPGSVGSALNFITACDSTPVITPEQVAAANIRQVKPQDPNFISGPGGAGAAQFVRNDALMPYQIGFENQPSASAPAQQVVVTQQLDPNLDLSTFQLGSFGFGGINVDVPTGRQYYSTRLDERATLGLFVDATASLDVATRTVTWTLTSIDPATLDQPASVSVGFLPPDDASGRGQGYVNYVVQPKSGLASGTTINAQASIVFDTNAPVATNVFSNALDADAPTSSVTALPATASSSAIDLAWSGSDGAGAGIASYDVFVSTDGGAFVPLLQGTTQTSTTFNGSDGHRYGFYSVATDNVGRRESDKTVADTTTSVPLQPPVLAGAGNAASFVQGGPAVVAAPSISVAGADSTTLSSARVAISAGLLAGDTLSATTAGTAITASYDATTGVLNLAGSDTLAHYQAVLDSVSFGSASANPGAYGSDTSRTLSWQVSDGTLASNVVTSSISIAVIDQAPVLGGAGTLARFTQGGAAVAVAPGLTVADMDSLQLASASVAITTGRLAGDTLAATTTGTAITASFDTTTGVLSLSGSDTLAHYQQVLDSVVFASPGPNPTDFGKDTTRGLSWQVSDGSLSSAVSSGSVAVIGVDQPPTLAGAGNTASFRQGGSPVVADAGITVGDFDSLQLASASVGIATGLLAGDTLAATTAGTAITATFDAATGVLSLIGSDTLAHYQAVLESVTFASSSADPSQAGSDSSRTLNWQVNDGTRVSDPVSSTATIVAATQPPVLQNPGDQSVVAGQVLALQLAASDADPSAKLIFSLVNGPAGMTLDAATGLLSWTAPYLDRTTSAPVTVQVADASGLAAQQSFAIGVDPALLKVIALTPTADGFHLAFSAAFDPSTLNLYDGHGASYGAADLGLFDAAGQRIAGSLVLDADHRGLTFVKTGAALADGSYAVRLDSRSDAFVDTHGRLLDGDADGVSGGGYTANFTLARNGAAQLSIGTIARAPGQTVAGGGALSITLDGAAGATSLDFTLQYDPSLLNVRGLSGGKLPRGSTLQVDASTPGLLHVSVRSSTPLPAGSITLGQLDATLPTTAGYGAEALLHLTDLRLDGGTRTLRGADGLEVVARPGDTDGNGRLTLSDEDRLLRVLAKQDSGFGAWPLVDPTVIADLDHNGRLDWVDALDLALQLVPVPHLTAPVLSAAAGSASGPTATATAASQKVIQPVTRAVALDQHFGHFALEPRSDITWIRPWVGRASAGSPPALRWSLPAARGEPSN